MARIRTIKPAFFRHGALFDAEQETGLPLRLAFAGLWTACDREGRFAWRPRELKLDVLPHDAVDFGDVLDALWAHGFIERYQVGAAAFGFVPSWHQHQAINNKESASTLPEPSEGAIMLRKSLADSRDDDASTTRELRDGDAMHTPLSPTRGEGKGREGKGIYACGVVGQADRPVPVFIHRRPLPREAA